MCRLAVSFWLFTIPNQPVNLAVHSIKEYSELNSEEKFWLTQQFLLVDLEACVLETAWCNVDEWQVLGIMKDELLIGRSELDTISLEHAPWWPWFSVYYKPRGKRKKKKNEKRGKHLTLISHLLSLLTVFWGSIYWGSYSVQSILLKTSRLWIYLTFWHVSTFTDVMQTVLSIVSSLEYWDRKC